METTERKEREVKVAIREMHSGEAPETYICGADFGKYSCIQANGYLGAQMDLVIKMLERVCEDGMETKPEHMPVVVAGFLTAMESAVGEEIMAKGVELTQKATKAQATFEELMESTKKLLEELGLLD